MGEAAAGARLVGAGAPDTREIDGRIDDLLRRFVWAMRHRHRKWRYRLESVFGKGLYGPSQLRLRMEARVRALGGRPTARRRPSGSRDPFRDFEENLTGLSELLKMMRARPESTGESVPQ